VSLQTVRFHLVSHLGLKFALVLAIPVSIAVTVTVTITFVLWLHFLDTTWASATATILILDKLRLSICGALEAGALAHRTLDTTWASATATILILDIKKAEHLSTYGALAAGTLAPLLLADQLRGTHVFWAPILVLSSLLLLGHWGETAPAPGGTPYHGTEHTLDGLEFLHRPARWARSILQQLVELAPECALLAGLTGTSDDPRLDELDGLDGLDDHRLSFGNFRLL